MCLFAFTSFRVKCHCKVRSFVVFLFGDLDWVGFDRPEAVKSCFHYICRGSDCNHTWGGKKTKHTHSLIFSWRSGISFWLLSTCYSTEKENAFFFQLMNKSIKTLPVIAAPYPRVKKVFPQRWLGQLLLTVTIWISLTATLLDKFSRVMTCMVVTKVEGET